MERPLARHLMSSSIIALDRQASLRDAAGVMRSGEVGWLPVLDGGGWSPVGTVTDHDIVVKGLAAGRDPQGTPVSSVMSDDLAVCHADEVVEEAAERMRERRIGRLLVTDRKGRPMGVLSRSDVLSGAADERIVRSVFDPGHGAGVFETSGDGDGRHEMQVDELMTAPVKSVRAEATLEKTAAVMRRSNVGWLPVLSRSGGVLGVITVRNIVTRAVADGLDASATSVEEVCSSTFVWCRSDHSAESAASVMARNGVRRLLVVNAGYEPVGVVSFQEVLPHVKGYDWISHLFRSSTSGRSSA
jgi:CBS domain-containing protein